MNGHPATLRASRKKVETGFLLLMMRRWLCAHLMAQPQRMTPPSDSAIPPSWQPALAAVLASPPLRALGGWLRAEEAAGKAIFPPRGTRLAALALTPLDQVRVVILGQDPYHGPGQAHGLAFSVQHGVRVPPSLVNIYKELQTDLGIPPARHGHLDAWARQGVLLLNNALTVEQGQPGSHQKRGWEDLTDAVVAAVAAQSAPCVFILWGSHAQKKAARIPGLNGGPHLVLKAPHPSPLSAHAGFFGSRPFSRANAFLAAHGRGEIDWRLPG
jgi:uracil-DNA glycosylase